ncbi:MAG: hypothetical protein EAZ74_01120 [Alphaproteobacteria bacterium]|nr:MAG: hypothetical protein EAZ74_01120 [Alphaproteobacteria bacterium]TAF77001.1 MAG: hypothetical protein EAZ52_02450 [Alphaproteobacteria bacterium]
MAKADSDCSPNTPYSYERFYAARVNLPMKVQDDLHSGNPLQLLKGAAYIAQHSNEPMAKTARETWMTLPLTFAATSATEFCMRMGRDNPQHAHAWNTGTHLSLLCGLVSLASFLVPLNMAIFKQWTASDAERATWIEPTTSLSPHADYQGKISALSRTVNLF